MVIIKTVPTFFILENMKNIWRYKDLPESTEYTIKLENEPTNIVLI